ncbi:hypothetical protein AGLY_009234 [Aphis glycines]|uniref:Uncharacterized protein n=1 Tax=Aphis glycines TaxID=307491 RepID=A0A6G0TI47_APHGL|nr:hypothetical protein AGLY_009234 [Aphis glycines]
MMTFQKYYEVLSTLNTALGPKNKLHNHNMIDFEIVRDQPVDRDRLFGRPWALASINYQHINLRVVYNTIVFFLPPDVQLCFLNISGFQKTNEFNFTLLPKLLLDSERNNEFIDFTMLCFYSTRYVDLILSEARNIIRNFLDLIDNEHYESIDGVGIKCIIYIYDDGGGAHKHCFCSQERENLRRTLQYGLVYLSSSDYLRNIVVEVISKDVHCREFSVIDIKLLLSTQYLFDNIGNIMNKSVQHFSLLLEQVLQYNITTLEYDPFHIETLASCNHALTVCESSPDCRRIFEDFKNNCKVTKDNTCETNKPILNGCKTLKVECAKQYNINIYLLRYNQSYIQYTSFMYKILIFYVSNSILWFAVVTPIGVLLQLYLYTGQFEMSVIKLRRLEWRLKSRVKCLARGVRTTGKLRGWWSCKFQKKNRLGKINFSSFALIHDKFCNLNQNSAFFNTFNINNLLQEYLKKISHDLNINAVSPELGIKDLKDYHVWDASEISSAKQFGQTRNSSDVNVIQPDEGVDHHRFGEDDDPRRGLSDQDERVVRGPVDSEQDDDVQREQEQGLAAQLGRVARLASGPQRSARPAEDELRRPVGDDLALSMIMATAVAPACP